MNKYYFCTNFDNNPHARAIVVAGTALEAKQRATNQDGTPHFVKLATEDEIMWAY